MHGILCLPGASFLLLLLAFSSAAAAETNAERLMPQIEEPWWTIATDPDLGDLTSPNQQPVDFAIWQAADGSWQLWSCVRNTKCGGNTRLFHRWEGKELTEKHWKPIGIAMRADPIFGETEGGLQAPHVVRIGDAYHMFYGDWENICLATSREGKSFTRRPNDRGLTGMFTEGPGANARDPMVMRIGNLWHCYYTAHPGNRGAVYCRTSPDLRTWSDSKVVAFGGRAGSGPYSAECPHVVYHAGYYYLFRTQRYGVAAQTSVYRSDDSMNFGIEDDSRFVCTLPVAAPEIIVHSGDFYIAALLPNLKGIRMVRLKWVRQP